MTGPEHYREAERLLEMAITENDKVATNGPISEGHALAKNSAIAVVIQSAQVHATLALAAATALNTPGGEDGGMYLPDAQAWERACSTVVEDEEPGE